MSRLVRLYPAAWRERYEVELREALASRPLTYRDLRDLLRGAVDARLHPELSEPVAGDLVLAGRGSMPVGGRTVVPWALMLGVLATAALVLAAFQVLVRVSGLYGDQHPQSVLLTTATLALGLTFLAQRGAVVTRLGGLTMIAICVGLIGQGWDGDHLTPAIALAMGGAIVGLGGLVHGRPGRWTGLALLLSAAALAVAVRVDTARGTALALLGYALLALVTVAPQLRRRRAAAAAALGLVLAGLVMAVLAWTDPWSEHDGYALGCQVDRAACLGIADTLAPAMRAHFPNGRVMAIEVRADGQVWACWRDDGAGRDGACRLGSPVGWPSGPPGFV